MIKKLFLAISLMSISMAAYSNEEKNLNNLHKKIEHAYRTAQDEKSISLSIAAIKKAEKMYGKENIKIEKSLVYLAKSMWISKRMNEAINAQKRLLHIREKHWGIGHENTISAVMRLGHLYYENKNYLKAKSTYEKLLRIEEKLFGKDSYEATMDKLSIARVYPHLNKNKKAISLHKHVLKKLEWLVENKEKLPKNVRVIDVRLTIVKVATALAELDVENAEYYKKKYGKVTYLR